MSTVAKIAEEALAERLPHQSQYQDRSESGLCDGAESLPPASLEVAGSRNQYVLSLHALPSNITRLSVKAEFEKLAQGGRILSVSAEEVAEIERSLIREIHKALASPSKT